MCAIMHKLSWVEYCRLLEVVHWQLVEETVFATSELVLIIARVY